MAAPEIRKQGDDRGKVRERVAAALRCSGDALRSETGSGEERGEHHIREGNRMNELGRSQRMTLGFACLRICLSPRVCVCLCACLCARRRESKGTFPSPLRKCTVSHPKWQMLENQWVFT